MAKKQNKEKKLEEALKELEEIVLQLEEGNLDLDKSLELFEKGVTLSRYCRTKLDEVERKISILLKDEKGKLQEEEFNIDEE